MANSRPTKKYDCSQGELYAIATIGWQSYDENLADFTAFSTKYDAQYGIDAMQAVESAKQLPDFQERNEPSETAHVELTDANQTCNLNWRILRRHINNAFPENVVKGKLESAGEEHYKKSLARNWSETELMLTSATNFINNNNAELTAGGMPAQFVTDFADAKTAFLGFYGTFTDAEQDELEGTDEKILANNAVYDTLMDMFQDGQVIYEENAAKRARFIFARVKDLITSSGGGSSTVPANTIEIGAYVFDSQTLLPIAGATLRVINGPEGIVEGVTDNEGITAVKVSGYPANATVMVESEVQAAGYDLVMGTAEMTAGNLYSVEVPMDPVQQP